MAEQDLGSLKSRGPKKPEADKSPSIKPPAGAAEEEDNMLTSFAGLDWSALSNTLKRQSGGQGMYLKPGKTVLRLMAKRGENPAEIVYTIFRSKKRPKYMVRAWVKSSPQEIQRPIQYLILAKTVWQSILAMLEEGYDFFGPEGYGITITKSGTGRDVEYRVIASREPVAVPPDVIAVLREDTQSLLEHAAAFTASQEQRAAMQSANGGGDDDEEEDEAPRDRRSQGRRRESDW